MLALLIDFLEDESGASSMEYALMAAFVAIVISGSLSVIGSNTSAAFTVASIDVDQVAYDTCVRTAKDPQVCQIP